MDKAYIKTEIDEMEAKIKHYKNMLQNGKYDNKLVTEGIIELYQLGLGFLRQRLLNQYK